MPTRVEWSNVPNVRRAMRNYGDAVIEAERQVALYWAAVIEADARNNAPWTDRTANARQSLHAYTNENAPDGYPNPQDLAKDVVALYLSHGMEYGVYLETRWAGRYAIIMPTLEKHYQQIATMLKGIFGR